MLRSNARDHHRATTNRIRSGRSGSLAFWASLEDRGCHPRLYSRHSIIDQRREFALPVFVGAVQSALLFAIEEILVGWDVLHFNRASAQRDWNVDDSAAAEDFKVNR